MINKVTCKSKQVNDAGKTTLLLKGRNRRNMCYYQFTSYLILVYYIHFCWLGNQI